MKALILLLALAGCAAPAAEEGDIHLTIPAARVAECNAEGGCALMSKAKVPEMLSEAVDAGAKAAREDLDSNGCRRGAT